MSQKGRELREIADWLAENNVPLSTSRLIDIASDYDALAAAHDFAQWPQQVAELKARVQRLEKALEWAIEGNRIVDYGNGIEGRSRGCGCCSYDEEIPESFRAELVAAYNRSHPKTPASDGDSSHG